MILTDREIKLAIERGSIVIDPRPGERAFASTSVDLTLDETFSVRPKTSFGGSVGSALLVIPAKAGIQAGRTILLVAWTPAFAGVTRTS